MIESSLIYNKFLDYIDKITPLVADAETLRQAADAVNAGMWEVLGKPG